MCAHLYVCVFGEWNGRIDKMKETRKKKLIKTFVAINLFGFFFFKCGNENALTMTVGENKIQITNEKNISEEQRNDSVLEFRIAFYLIEDESTVLNQEKYEHR